MNPLERLKHTWNLFVYDESPKRRSPTNYGVSYYQNPNRVRFSRGNERTIVTSVYNRIALDAAAIEIRHVKMDNNNRFLDYISSGLDNCLSVEANIDQTARNFIQDIVSSLLDEGCVAVVPIDTSFDPNVTNSYDIQTMRVGKITQWYPDKVTVLLYNDSTGLKQEVTIPKRQVAIIENPLYAVMNEPNSTMQRLIKKLSLMDSADEEIASGNLDLIIQLPYAVKTESRRNLAESRRKEVEEQLNGSRYGVAYIDGTEHVTQLNRPVENNLMKQVEYLTAQLYSQLGLTQTIMDGTADENTMNNYYNRTIEPILSAIVDEFNRKFLTKTARTQKQAIMYFRDPFRLIPVTSISEMADKFTRNEIMTSNEIRQLVGFKPSDDPNADELRNKNLSQSAKAIEEKMQGRTGTETVQNEKEETVND